MTTDAVFTDRLGPEPTWEVVADELDLALTDPDERIDTWFPDITFEDALSGGDWPQRPSTQLAGHMVREYTSYTILPTLVRYAAALNALARYWPSAAPVALGLLHARLLRPALTTDSDRDRKLSNLVLSRSVASWLRTGDTVHYRLGQRTYDAVVNRVTPVGAVIAWSYANGKPMTATVPAHLLTPAVIDAAHLRRQRAWSSRTFGPGVRLGVLDHIRKELDEIAADPSDLSEWVDVVILALDGALRAGHEPQSVIDAIHAKQSVNESRTWPDWRTLPANKAIEHDRSEE